MAEEKKPKIDLKARLGKTAAGARPPPGAVIPTASSPIPSPSGRPPPAPGSSAPGARAAVPVPPGMPVGPPPAFGGGSRPPQAIDPSNPLAAVAAPYRAPAPPPPQRIEPQRIEMDEFTVQEARKGARKQGLIAGVVLAVALGIIGYIAGGAVEASSGRKKATNDAKELAVDVGKAKDSLKVLTDKMDAGRNSLVKEKKFPDTLAKDLGGMNIDFDGSKLAGRRFSGFPQETTASLVEFITAVQALNDRKLAVVNLLNKLQKPLTEQFAAAGKQSIAHVVLLGRKDESGNSIAILAPLVPPLQITPPNVTLPAEFTFVDPFTKQNSKLAKYGTGDLAKPAAIYVVPKSFDASCPNETAGQAAQLASQIGLFIRDINGEAASGGGDAVVETKAGLIERAEKLVVSLNKVN